MIEEGECPLETITPDVWDLLTAADLAAKGSWPNAGGWLDQPACVVTGVQIVWAEESKHRVNVD